MTSYKVVRSNPDSLIQLLKEHELKHSQTFFYELRGIDTSNLTDVQITARFIYLNKASYAGIYRVDDKGNFLGTWGHRDKRHIPSDENLSYISSYLNSTDCQILCNDYQSVLPLINQGDYLFLDPPYDGTTAFYTAAEFSQDNQTEL
jgi:DNA adenine methylase